ncbi:hypothetical protein LPLM1_00094 [Listeria phage LPML1]|nr:hypothetical protein LPLM1_00094 [Listeria phage LPML1]
MKTLFSFLKFLCWVFFWCMLFVTLNSVYNLIVAGYIVLDIPAIIAVTGTIVVMYLLTHGVILCIKGFLDILERLWGRD